MADHGGGHGGGGGGGHHAPAAKVTASAGIAGLIGLTGVYYLFTALAACVVIGFIKGSQNTYDALVIAGFGLAGWITLITLRRLEWESAKDRIDDGARVVVAGVGTLFSVGCLSLFWAGVLNELQGGLVTDKLWYGLGLGILTFVVMLVLNPEGRVLDPRHHD